MRHFAFLAPDERTRLFLRAPEPFTIDDAPEGGARIQTTWPVFGLDS